VFLAIPDRLSIVAWFRAVLGDSFTFTGLVAGIEVIRAFRLFAGLFFVRILVVIVGHKALQWLVSMATAGAGDQFLSNWTVYSASGLIRAFVKPAHADAAGEWPGLIQSLTRQINGSSYQ
jgi:hypothetical protein